MANTEPVKEEIDVKNLNDFQKHLHRDYREDLQNHDDAIKNFDAYEAMHMGQTYDAVSKETGNGLTDSKTATIYLERAARVAGQLPDGQVEAFGKKDYGKGLFMDLLRTKWIYPNANAQRSFRTKMFMWQYGSSEYGFMPMFYDLNVTPGGYFGPDCWLWNPRMFVPQAGFTSIADMDYVHALANKSPRFFEDLLEEKTGNKKEDKSSGWKFDAIEDLIEQIKNSTKTADPQRDTMQQRKQSMQPIRQITIATRYEAGKRGRWISFLPDFNYKVIRNIPNPHKNGRIPFVIKPCIPTFDSFYNIGDFQRSMPMQFANDGLDNFYFQGIKVNLFPRTVINAQGVIRHTMTNEAGGVIETTGNVNDVKTLDTSSAGLSTYQAAKGMAQGAIQSIAGTTDTRVNADSSTDPGFGKTPEALKMIASRESTRDNQDRQLLEEAMTELIDGMLSLIPTMENRIPIDLFAHEIEDIIDAGHDDIKDIFDQASQDNLIKMRESDSGDQLRIRIDPSALKGLEYRFQLTSNSTVKKDKEAQLQSMMDFLTFIGKMPNALDQYKEVTGMVPDWQYVFTQFGDLADIPGMDKMFMQAPEPPQPEVPEETAGGGITPEQLAQAAAAQPQDIANGAMQPQAPAPAPAAPVAPVLPPAPTVNPITGQPYSPEMQAEIARLHAMRG